MLTLVGNKMDLVDDEDGRPVTTKDGVRLAEVHVTLFLNIPICTEINHIISGMIKPIYLIFY